MHGPWGENSHSHSAKAGGLQPLGLTHVQPTDNVVLADRSLTAPCAVVGASRSQVRLSRRAKLCAHSGELVGEPGTAPGPPASKAGTLLSSFTPMERVIGVEPILAAWKAVSSPRANPHVGASERI